MPLISRHFTITPPEQHGRSEGTWVASPNYPGIPLPSPSEALYRPPSLYATDRASLIEAIIEHGRQNDVQLIDDVADPDAYPPTNTLVSLPLHDGVWYRYTLSCPGCDRPYTLLTTVPRIQRRCPLCGRLDISRPPLEPDQTIHLPEPKRPSTDRTD